jgi:hypothetical protein
MDGAQKPSMFFGSFVSPVLSRTTAKPSVCVVPQTSGAAVDSTIEVYEKLLCVKGFLLIRVFLHDDSTP